MTTDTPNNMTRPNDGAPPTQGLAWQHLANGRTALVARLDKYMYEKDWPFVDVDAAKKAIFNATNIKTFDYIVYNASGPNLLMLVVTGRPTSAQVKLMKEWEHLFGEGFLTAFVFLAADIWQLVLLNDLQTPNPLAHVRLLDVCLKGNKQ